MNMISKELLQRLLLRSERSHKGSYGSLLLIAGSASMMGAAILTALAAFKSGVGKVHLVTVTLDSKIINSRQCKIFCVNSKKV